ncbi:MAG: Na/Pi cotransporter family protein [Erysipelotrichaceae bacterium]|nr:Na/Pi cotransporter family protein [Erysipelotrichaceae bacterium]
MTLTNIFALLGGLALFLYGMNIMASGFKHMAGSKLQQILEKLTSTPLVGVIVGVFVTAIIQSSSATTSMLVGFVNAGVMSVTQTVGVIMGANIGTTMTGQLIALDFDVLAPLIAFIGIIFIVFMKNPKMNAVGEILAGLGFLFMGMDMMSGAMKPLQSSPFFLGLIKSMKNPLFGIMVGAVFTALIQSSSASVGIIQTLAKSGVLGVADVVYFNCGQHIGTCVTAVLASLGLNRDARRVATIHVVFNVLGTVMFTLVYMMIPLHKLYIWLAPNNPVAQIAIMHSVFSITTSVVLFPLGKYLAKFAYWFIPDQHSVKDLKLEITTPAHGKDTAVANLFGINVELNHMYGLVRDNIEESMIALLENRSSIDLVHENEHKIDIIHKGIIRSISKAISSNISVDESNVVARMFQINKDIERMGDHALNLAESCDYLAKRNLKITPEIVGELYEINEIILMSLNSIDRIASIKEEHRYQIVSQNEDRLDYMCYNFRENQIKRMNEEKQNFEVGIIYTEILTDIERIGDHIFNIANELAVND